jgi:hypothetical protein
LLRWRRVKGRSTLAVLAVAVAIGGLGGSADAKKRKRSNMPENWSWPPSRQMKLAGKLCTRELTRMGIKWKKAGSTRKVATPIVIPDMMIGDLKLTSIFRKPPFVMDCHLALAFAQHGHLLTEAGISELRFSTIHEYRHVRLGGRTRSALSRHALGLAMDVFEFVLADGTKLVVDDDYGTEQGLVLAQVETALFASGGFRGILTPGNDPRSHDDHFHFEAKFVIDGTNDRRASRASKKARRLAARRAKRAKAKRIAARRDRERRHRASRSALPRSNRPARRPVAAR